MTLLTLSMANIGRSSLIINVGGISIYDTKALGLADVSNVTLSNITNVLPPVDNKRQPKFLSAHMPTLTSYSFQTAYRSITFGDISQTSVADLLPPANMVIV